MDNDPTNVHDVQPEAYHVGERPASSCSATAHSDPFDDDNIMEMLSTQDPLATEFEPSFGDQVAIWAALTGTGSRPWDGPVMMDHSHHAMANALDDFMRAEFPPTARHPPSSPSQSQLQPTSSPPYMHPSESRGYKQLQVDKGGLAALVRRAAELCDNMYELRIKYHNGHSELDLPGQFPMYMSGEVLQAADEFLRLLRCFFLDAPSGSSTPTLGSSNPSSRMSSTSSLVAPAEQTQRVAYVADRPAALTLIASYRRLLDLYLLYYQAVYEYVRDTEPAWRRHQPIWKDLNVGGAPLREFGDLHIQLVIQAAARVLEDVESALGLSEGCRVSRNSAVVEGDGGGNGVLGAVVTSRFVEQCIAEGTTGGSEQGAGIIVRIREMAASVAAVLDAPVAIERPTHAYI
ncbi:hypothetical protein C8A01DRAFT_32011 [Parachaetomium inaequale]|uniref:Uncharacterized protein n=1 Tax=Parachaetomium inaequale TaxID=2588326 RepID=A0AAN6SVT3_9PEZI|nr:hypothetical protein C8A01DRAFT_32011 [Parachaetomium inaequale]